jgi:hypothetical protein
MTLDRFNQIKMGMPFYEVAEIMGDYGTVMSEAGSGQYHTTLHSWSGNGTVGSNANVTFQNGTVIAKAQVGLE